MRERIFRGKILGSDEWIYGDLRYCGGKYSIYSKGRKAELVQENTIGEYTGLKDKNGWNVFEGDICKVVYLDKRCNSSGEHYFAENIIIEEVAFYKGTFCFKTTIEDITMYRPIGFEIYEKQKIKYFEVLGNIYDNSELLNNE